MRPVHERPVAGILHEFAAHRDPVARSHRHGWCELDVVDDFKRPTIIGTARE